MPPLPADAVEAIDAGLSALGLVGDVAVRAARPAIEGHLRLVLAWTSAINLTAIRDPLEAARLHVLDSLAAIPVLRERGATRLLDLGSGAGYPGLPLALAVPADEALLVDSVGKKAAFLDVAIRAVTDGRGEPDGPGGAVRGPSIRAVAARAEALAAEPRHRQRWPIVTARAVAGLAELVELAFPLLEVGGALVAWKREGLDGGLAAELEAGRRAARALGGGRVWVVDVAAPGLAGHRLVVAEKRAPTPPSFPRDPAVRRRRPVG